MDTAQADAMRLDRVKTLILECFSSISGLRILDLASRVGAFSDPLAREGASVLGIEARQENIDQAPPITPGLDLHYECDDVRSVTAAVTGTFDVVLCLGLLYHLDAKSARDLLLELAQMSTLLILDTHISTAGETITHLHSGHRYTGHIYADYTDSPWGSYKNETSFWFTIESLTDLLTDCGFRDVKLIAGRAWPGESSDRFWFTAEGCA